MCVCFCYNKPNLLETEHLSGHRNDPRDPTKKTREILINGCHHIR